VNNGRNSATLARNTLPDRVQPTRSAITDAGIAGNSASRTRIAGSKPSTADPTRRRSYLGGPTEANARDTAPRETPSRRATARADNPSDRCNRRISAQSSTASTPLTVRGGPLFSRQHWPSFHPASTDITKCQSGVRGHEVQLRGPDIAMR
jgi:hypothetical protein